MIHQINCIVQNQRTYCEQYPLSNTDIAIGAFMVIFSLIFLVALMYLSEKGKTPHVLMLLFAAPFIITCAYFAFC